MDKTNFIERIKSDPARLFLFCVLIAVIFIVLGATLLIFNEKFLQFFSQNFIKTTGRLISVVIPIFMMLIYITILNDKDNGNDFRPFPLSIEQKADSIYYMGFILTLTAMTASLASLAILGDTSFDSIVFNFALALITTLIGLTVRVLWLTTASYSLSDEESKLKDKMIRRSQELNEEIEIVVKSIKSVSSEISNASEPINKGFNNLINILNIDDNLKIQLKALEQSAESAAIGLKLIANITESLDSSISRLKNNVNNDLITQLDKLTISLNDVHPKLENFDKDFENEFENVKTQLKYLRAALSITNESLDKNKANLDKYNVIVEEHNATLEENTSLLKRIRNLFK